MSVTASQEGDLLKSEPRPSARDRLLAAANELFYKEGVHTVGIDRVIDRAGVAKASLYNTFGSKDELVRAYLEARHASVAARITRAIAKHDNPRSKLLGVFDAQGELFAEPDFRGCAFVSASSESPTDLVAEAADNYRGWVRSLLTDLARDCGVTEPENLGRQLHLLYDGAGLSARMDRDPAAAVAARKAAETLLDAALAQQLCYLIMCDRSALVESVSPTLSRRHEAGAPSARGMLLTLLGEFVLPADGTAWTSAVLASFGRLGVAEKATRQALMRTSNAGWLEPEKIGRRTRWRLTRSAEKLLTDGAERIYSFGPAPDWGGQWVLVQVRIPESDRRARHVVRTRLTWAGFGSLGASLWISPHPARQKEAEKVLRDAGVADAAHVFVATRTGMTDTRAMVAQAWDLPAIEAQYEGFTAEFGDPHPQDVLARQLELVHAWRRFPSLDPALPRELLPAHWTGEMAARLFADRHEQWLDGSRTEWKRLNAENATNH
jgi:phenylacetic acid degradation operon negative regulatory protein